MFEGIMREALYLSVGHFSSSTEKMGTKREQKMAGKMAVKRATVNDPIISHPSPVKNKKNWYNTSNTIHFVPQHLNSTPSPDIKTKRHLIK